MMPRWFIALLVAAALAAVATPARADGGDVVHFGRAIHIDHGEEVDNAVCFFCNVQVDGTVTGDAVSILGNLRIAGDVQHDAVVVLGGLTAERGASVEQDVIAVLGEARLGESVIVGRDVVTFSGAVQMAPTAAVGNERIDNPGWYIWIPLALAILIVLWVMRSYRAYRKRLVARGYKFRNHDDDE